MTDAESIYAAVKAGVQVLGDFEERTTRSQTAWRRRCPFAAVWRPSQYLRGDVAPLVLTIYLPFRDVSARWKEVVEPAPGRFTHHLELRSAEDVDGEVLAWLRRAWEAAAS